MDRECTTESISPDCAVVRCPQIAVKFNALRMQKDALFFTDIARLSIYVVG